MWSGGLPKRSKKREQKEASVPSVPLTDDDGDDRAPVGSIGGFVGTYRLIVTDDGNAILKRGDVEVVWKALHK